MTAADAGRLADLVRSEYLTRKRDTEPVAAALDVLHRILIWAETPSDSRLAPDGVTLFTMSVCKEHVQRIAGNLP